MMMRILNLKALLAMVMVVKTAMFLRIQKVSYLKRFVHVLFTHLNLDLFDSDRDVHDARELNIIFFLKYKPYSSCKLRLLSCR